MADKSYIPARDQSPTPPWRFEASDFGKCRWLGLQNGGDQEYADAANAKLAEWRSASPVVYGYLEGNWFVSPEHRSLDTHTAKLICVEPIRKDTAESLLREMREQIVMTNKISYSGPLIARIDALLEREGK